MKRVLMRAAFRQALTFALDPQRGVVSSDLVRTVRQWRDSEELRHLEELVLVEFAQGLRSLADLIDYGVGTDHQRPQGPTRKTGRVIPVSSRRAGV